MAVFRFVSMSKTAILLFVLSLVGCVSLSDSSQVSQRDEIIQIAKREIDRRHVHVPKGCDITVVDGVTAFEVGKAREEHLVRFTLSNAGKREVIYEVSIDKRTKKVNDFVDYRNTIPGNR